MSDRIAVMNRGRYEQLGDPETLYERPTTRFVAGFLGVSNLLPGRPTGRPTATRLVKMADGSPVRVPTALVDGRTQVALGVRPEKIPPPRSRDGNAGRVQLALGHGDRRASYIGVSTQYIVETRRWNPGRRLRAEHRTSIEDRTVERSATRLSSRGPRTTRSSSGRDRGAVADARCDPSIGAHSGGGATWWIARADHHLDIVTAAACLAGGALDRHCGVPRGLRHRGYGDDRARRWLRDAAPHRRRKPRSLARSRRPRVRRGPEPPRRPSSTGRTGPTTSTSTRTTPTKYPTHRRLHGQVRHDRPLPGGHRGQRDFLATIQPALQAGKDTGWDLIA